MERLDQGLAFLLQYENIAWYEPGRVRILDRRVYPYRQEYVTCYNYQQVAQAIADMVTQSGGPYLAAAMGMVLAVDEARQKGKNIKEFTKTAAQILANARPTTAQKMKVITETSYQAIERALEAGEDPLQAAFAFALDNVNQRYHKIKMIARHLVHKFPRSGTVMTQCFAETIVGMMLLECQKQQKEICFICPETRPYLQGARLTASVISDMGYPVHVISDNMPAYIMGREGVDVFTSAADVITMDGYVVNKVGTFQIALAAFYHKIPYFVTGSPNQQHQTIDSVKIEERNTEEVRQHMGIRVTKENVKAYYPAFDITPPQYCSGVVTPRGIYSPWNLKDFFEV